MQYLLHAPNHVLDSGRDHPAWVGPLDVVAPGGGALLVATLLRAALQAEGRS
ncbi:hypothetical protein [Baekduia soli]|uniref:hypothetical protein n=1 Tax=Baekduia soli TaxID=496014 RepID=UPI001652693D|nr:hypothetical protein [Baekduia soli]